MSNNLLSIAINFNNIKILKAALDLTSEKFQFLLVAMQKTHSLLSLNWPLFKTLWDSQTENIL